LQGWSDLTAATFRVRPTAGARLPCPITVFGGADDAQGRQDCGHQFASVHHDGGRTAVPDQRGHKILVG
jgi:surfactin synthase thioesterase subunit